METLTIRAVKLTGIPSDPEQKPDVKHIPIISLNQLSDERWNELARANAKMRIFAEQNKQMFEKY